MSLQPGLRTLIEIPVSDRIFGDTVIKQKAIFTTLVHNQQPNGECSAVINVIVRSYGVKDDDYGISLADKGMPDRHISLTADNNSVVDMATNEILATRVYETNAEWQDIIDSFPQATMLQGDFFELVRKYSPIDIEDMIRGHIVAADAPPFSRFS